MSCLAWSGIKRAPREANNNKLTFTFSDILSKNLLKDSLLCRELQSIRKAYKLQILLKRQGWTRLDKVDEREYEMEIIQSHNQKFSSLQTLT